MTEITTTSAAEVAAETAEFSAANGTVGSDFERMIGEIRDHDRFLLTAHEGPDGDALGSLLGMHHLLTKLGKDSVMFLAAKEFPLPIEYRFLPLENVFHEAPADMADRVIMFLDCGNIDRMPVPFLTEGEQPQAEHRPPPRQHPLRRRQPGRRRRPRAPPRSSTTSPTSSGCRSTPRWRCRSTSG